MTDKPVNLSSDNSGAHGSAPTPLQTGDRIVIPDSYWYNPDASEDEKRRVMEQATLPMAFGPSQYNPTGPLLTKEQYAEYAARKADRFPQEIVEPQPKPWWKRWLR